MPIPLAKMRHWFRPATLLVSLGLALPSWLLLSVVWVYSPKWGLADKVIGSLFRPGFVAGRFVGELLFPTRAVPYVVPLLGAAGQIAIIAIIWCGGIVITRSARSDNS
ncbi:MAG TPA: hypothetical protein VD837_07475 [Terriglobales bacterium]|nr:hypothetical protein [Terriglobales bacterium]